MKSFITENFLLQTKAAKILYHDYAKVMPIIDFHTHLPADEIAEDKKFKNLAEIWLKGDHYKWRAMRTNGVDEKYCTGDVDDYEKFKKWAETVPNTIRNPLYHWTHMELKQSLDIDKMLNPDTAEAIYNDAREKLQQDEYSTVSLLKRWNVDAVFTTDDPVDSLNYHKEIQKSDINVKVLPTWRADKTLAVEDPKSFNSYIESLEQVTNTSITDYVSLLNALRQRHDYFAETGCKASDHGIETFYNCDWTQKEVSDIFAKIRKGNSLTAEEQIKYKMGLLHELAIMDHEKDWVQQYHYGAIRNNNTNMYRKLGVDSGFDSIDDQPVAKAMSHFFDRLDQNGQLTKTILYNLNPADNEMIASMIGNFQDGKTPGKMQFGPAWWFSDNIRGMEEQLEALSNIGLISQFVGMLTDSRSFLSFSRHDYFRRILSNLLGNDMEKGLLPYDFNAIGQIVQNICYYNAKQYFNS